MTCSNRLERTVREDGVVISTIEALAFDWYGKYETAISFDGEKTWHIAESYETAFEALKGHEKYSNMSLEYLETEVHWLDY